LVKIKTHPGATTDDLIDHLNPVLRRKPDVIIIHGGTNDLTNDVDTAKNIERIIRNVKRVSPKTSLVLSSVVVRKDREDLAKKVIELNEKLKAITDEYKIEFLDNDNITDKYLNSKKLHLNKNGLSMLAKNILGYINSI
jgi:lysophospholipase L1-like esterase